MRFLAVLMVILSIQITALAAPTKLVFPPDAAVTLTSEPEGSDFRVKISYPKPANLSAFAEWGTSIYMKAVRPDGTKESYEVHLKPGINMALADKGDHMEWYFGPYVPSIGGAPGYNDIVTLPAGTKLTVKVTASAFNEATGRWSKAAALSIRGYVVG